MLAFCSLPQHIFSLFGPGTGRCWGFKWEGVSLFLNPQQGILPPRSGQAQSILSIHTNSLQGAGLYLFVKLFTPWSKSFPWLPQQVITN